MKIDSIMVGPIMTNCYLLSDETAGVCALIDPGDEAPPGAGHGGQVRLPIAVYPADPRPL